MNGFLFLDFEHHLFTIQLDTAEIENQNFEFIRPEKNNNPNYCTELRTQVIDLINDWLENNYREQILYAITIEELEAWCLTLFQKKDTSLSANPKNQLQRILQKKSIKIDGNNKARSFENKVTKDFRKFKKLEQYSERNQSFKDFVVSTMEKLENFVAEED